MERETRAVLTNIRLTKEEATTLWEAQRIIATAIKEATSFGGEVEHDLLEKLDICMDGMKTCYPRINVSTTCGKDYVK